MKTLFRLTFIMVLFFNAQVVQADQPKSYGAVVGHKLVNGMTNMVTAVLEIPKNIINTTNQNKSNIAYGIVGGMLKGVLNTSGRLISGATDFVTAPIPTQQFVQPAYIWDDFDADTTYGKVFRLEDE